MHPALGLGEDWNYFRWQLSYDYKLHPALGLGEDWNNRNRGETERDIKLHPALGLGEDWNTPKVMGYANLAIAPGFRAG